MDSKRGGAILICMIVLLAVIWLALSHYKTKAPIPAKAPTAAAAPAFTLTVTHSAQGNVHTYEGEMELPTPCHTLEAAAVMAYTKPPYLTLDLTSTTTSATCAQEVTKQPFAVSVSSDAVPTVAAELNGKPGTVVVIEK